ncbi:hypothetical protein JRQ81_019458 [Phrynocephalus forsythii]|uniref:Uncharacterized protein n=1 Tax=Phrynocephalus forsythii TaxID=171643 RepID=A0A9Q0XN04_9SAUR|nr:hypothetical protein JRQ81_019458 [Phrynocephalus forsythii]
MMELHQETQEEQVTFAEEGISKEPVSTSELREVCQKWDEVRTFAELHHSDPSLAYEFSKDYENFIMSQFKGTMRKHMKQWTLDSFLVKRPRKDPSGDDDQPSTSSSS